MAFDAGKAVLNIVLSCAEIRVAWVWLDRGGAAVGETSGGSGGMAGGGADGGGMMCGGGGATGGGIIGGGVRGS